MTTRSLLASLAAFTATAAACGGGAYRPFPARPPMWEDGDKAPIKKPKKYVAPEIWDTVDNTLFRPLVETLAVTTAKRAVNVNSLDEVPDSAWFTNRSAESFADVEAIRRGACVGDPPDPAGPWTVKAGKPDGANPGFVVVSADGRKYMFKPDLKRSGERQSTADLIGTRAYYAAGYYTACTLITYVDPKTFQLAPDAEAKDFVGDPIPFTPGMLEGAIRDAIRDDQGRIRGELSQFVEGAPIGPWVDFGTRPDDPNDVVAHEDRRELRGSYVLAAWLGHYDAREQNSLDAFIETGDGVGYVRHYMFDFGDCLGSQSAWDRVSHRRGHAYEVEWSLAFVELVTLGVVDRPWRDPHRNPVGTMLNFFNDAPFAPDRYRTAYPYGPFTRLTEADAAWGARILARISPAAIHGLVAEARLTDPLVAAELERVLLGRRKKLLQRFLTVLSPLTRPRVTDDGRLCLADARADGGLISVPGALTARAIDGLATDAALPITDGEPGERCIGGLPAGAGMPAYVVLEARVDKTKPMQIHLYADQGHYRVAGLDRQE
jgi:hypothetical protein